MHKFGVDLKDLYVYVGEKQYYVKGGSTKPDDIGGLLQVTESGATMETYINVDDITKVPGVSIDSGSSGQASAGLQLIPVITDHGDIGERIDRYCASSWTLIMLHDDAHYMGFYTSREDAMDAARDIGCCSRCSENNIGRDWDWEGGVIIPPMQTYTISAEEGEGPNHEDQD